LRRRALLAAVARMRLSLTVPESAPLMPGCIAVGCSSRSAEPMLTDTPHKRQTARCGGC
jgi:hypothetical protein